MPSIAGPSAEPVGSERGTVGKLRAVGIGVGLTVAAIVVSLVGGVAFAIPLFLLEYDVESTPVFLALTVASQLGFLAVAYWYAHRRGLRVRIDPPTGRGAVYVVVGTIAALLAVSGLSYLLERLDMVPGSVLEEIAAGNPNILLGLAALSVIVVAPIEEFLFRGVIQGRLRQSFGPVGAVAGSSLLFGSVHLANYTGALGSVLAGALLIAGTGLVLGIVYELTRNLTVPIAVHAIYNVVLLVSANLAI